jgi:hypothetical protein
MGKLSPDQAKTLADLQALAEAPDEDDEYEVRIEHDGRTMTVPWSKVPKSWRDHFGFVDPAAAAGEAGEGGAAGENGAAGAAQGDPKPKGPNRYFT